MKNSAHEPNKSYKEARNWGDTWFICRRIDTFVTSVKM
mgnify:CR=1 FL=1